MASFAVTPTTLKDAILITPTVFKDERGFFMESYNAKSFKEIGITDNFTQDNHAKSKQGVLRGMHFQTAPHPIVKLVRCLQGEIFDVIVDLRPNSPTYKKWEGFTLSAENQKMLYVPIGFAHAYYVVSETSEFAYKVTDYYGKEWDGGFRWDDPEIGIVWPGKNPILSEKDAKLPFLKDLGEIKF